VAWNVVVAFRFEGQETDDEVYGAENAVSYKYRVHDSRLGRFLSVDPLAPEYPHNSPYAFSENRVIDHIELEGLESVDPQALEAEVMTGIGEGILSFFESLMPTSGEQSSRDPLPQDPGSNGNYDPIKRIYLEEKVGLGLINFGIEADLGVPIGLKAEALKVEGGGQFFLEYSDSDGLVIGLDRSTSEVNYGGGINLAGAYGYEFRNEHSLREHPVFSKDVEEKMTLLTEETIQDGKTTEVKTEIFSLGAEVNLFITFGLKAAIEVVHERNLDPSDRVILFRFRDAKRVSDGD
jgi:RHS repeat-associated protein